MFLYICNEHHNHRFFFLDHITKLVHVNPIGHGGEGEGIVPAADFFVCCGSIRDLKPLTKSKKPMVKKIKVKIVDYTIFISTSQFELQIQFRPTTKLYIRRCFGQISFTQENLVSQKTISHN